VYVAKFQVCSFLIVSNAILCLDYTSASLLKMSYLDYIRTMASQSVMGSPNEYDAYSVVTEAFIYHKSPYNRYTIFPQFYFQWKPNDPKDYRGSIPDFVLGRYVDAWPWVRLQGGAEVKRATEAMQGLPLPNIMALDKNVQRAVADTRNQARDQAVSAIKEGWEPLHVEKLNV